MINNHETLNCVSTKFVLVKYLRYFFIYKYTMRVILVVGVMKLWDMFCFHWNFRRSVVEIWAQAESSYYSTELMYCLSSSDIFLFEVKTQCQRQPWGCSVWCYICLQSRWHGVWIVWKGYVWLLLFWCDMRVDLTAAKWYSVCFDVRGCTYSLE